MKASVIRNGNTSGIATFRYLSRTNSLRHNVISEDARHLISCRRCRLVTWYIAHAHC